MSGNEVSDIELISEVDRASCTVYEFYRKAYVYNKVSQPVRSA